MKVLEKGKCGCGETTEVLELFEGTATIKVCESCLKVALGFTV